MLEEIELRLSIDCPLGKPLQYLHRQRITEPPIRFIPIVQQRPQVGYYEFYQRIYKLKGWVGPDGHRRTPLIGHYTNDIVYERLVPGVLEELRRLNPPLPSGHRPHRHHQWFTPDLGYPKLKEHLAGVVALMRASSNWDSFRRNLARAYPKMKEQIPLPLEED